MSRQRQLIVRVHIHCSNKTQMSKENINVNSSDSSETSQVVVIEAFCRTLHSVTTAGHPGPAFSPRPNPRPSP